MEDNICNLLIKTYNVKKIDSASNELKDALMRIRGKYQKMKEIYLKNL